MAEAEKPSIPSYLRAATTLPARPPESAEPKKPSISRPPQAPPVKPPADKEEPESKPSSSGLPSPASPIAPTPLPPLAIEPSPPPAPASPSVPPLNPDFAPEPSATEPEPSQTESHLSEPAIEPPSISEEPTPAPIAPSTPSITIPSPLSAPSSTPVFAPAPEPSAAPIPPTPPVPPAPPAPAVSTPSTYPTAAASAPDPAPGNIKEETMVQTRNVMIFGEITQKVAQDVCEKLFLLAAHSDEPIKIFLNSDGGDMEASNCIHDMINLVQPPVKVIGTGVVTGAGALIFVAPPLQDRYSLPNTRFTLYQPDESMNPLSSEVSPAVIEAAKMRQRAAEIVSRQTEQPLERVQMDMENAVWMTAEDAKTYGLVGQIVANLNEIK